MMYNGLTYRLAVDRSDAIAWEQLTADRAAPADGRDNHLPNEEAA